MTRFAQKRFLLALGLIAFFSLLIVACGTISNEEEPNMANINKGLVGKWKKMTPAKCDEAYPDDLEFLDGGIYLVPSRADRFTLWQSGDYELEQKRVKIQSATDAMLEYDLSISDDDILTFVDDQGCEFKYERAQ